MHPPHRNGMKWSLLGPFHFSVASIPFKSEKSFVSFHSAPRSPLEEAEDRLGHQRRRAGPGAAEFVSQSTGSATQRRLP